MSYPAVRTHIILPKDLKEGIDDLVGSRNRSQFLSEAGREKLTQMRLLKSARAAFGSVKRGHVPEWNTHEGTVKWVRSLRREADEHMRRAHAR